MIDAEAREENQEPHPGEPGFFKEASVEKVLAYLKTSSRGLSTDEVKIRQKKYGLNEVASTKRPKGKVARRVQEEFQRLRCPKVQVLRDGEYIELPVLELVTYFNPK